MSHKIILPLLLERGEGGGEESVKIVVLSCERYLPEEQSHRSLICCELPICPATYQLEAKVHSRAAIQPPKERLFHADASFFATAARASHRGTKCRCDT